MPWYTTAIKSKILKETVEESLQFFSFFRDDDIEDSRLNKIVIDELRKRAALDRTPGVYRIVGSTAVTKKHLVTMEKLIVFWNGHIDSLNGKGKS